MPPRYAYWTIFIDDQPTAFRAREREELQPTLVQLQRKNANVVMRWFARGKLWESREAEQADFQQQRRAALEPRDRRDRPPAGERRGNDWRPGGTHKDPRDRFKKKNRPERAWSEKDPATQRDRDKPGYVAKKPWQKPDAAPGYVAKKPWQKPDAGPGTVAKKPWQKPDAAPGYAAKKPWQKPDVPREGKPPAHRSAFDNRKREGGWQNKPPVPNDRPWQTKPTGPRAQRKPWIPKPSGERPWNKSATGAPRGDRPWRDKPAGRPPRERRPWTDKPAGPPRGDRPPAPRGGFDNRKREGGWSGKPGGSGDRKPWQNRPADPNRKPPAPRGSFDSRKSGGGFPPRGSGPDRKFNPRAPRTGGRPPRRRDDED